MVSMRVHSLGLSAMISMMDLSAMINKKGYCAMMIRMMECLNILCYIMEHN
jgi:hypothetical protein